MRSFNLVIISSVSLIFLQGGLVPVAAEPTEPIEATFALSKLHSTLHPQLFWIILALMVIFLVDMVFVLMNRRQTEKQLKESRDEINLLLNSAAEGIYGLDLNGNCTFCNQACLDLLGYEREELLGKNLHEMVHHTRADGSPYPADECRICHAYLYNSQVHLEDEVLWKKNGSGFPVEYWSYPLHRGNKTVGAVVSFLDITTRKLAEQKLLTANKELDAFVYTVSHDLRTPISAVIGYADLLKTTHKEALDAEGHELLSIIEQQGEKMSLLVEDLLALATAGNISPPEEPVDTNEVLHYVLSELKNEITRLGARVKVAELPTARVPETLLIQIFENLIGNALRYAGPEGSPIEIGGERKGREVHYFVRDHGKGIPDNEQLQIFDVFYRGTTGKGVTGSGVGLATVQKICQLNGGHAAVETTPGGGATFRIVLKESQTVEETEQDQREGG